MKKKHQTKLIPSKYADLELHGQTVVSPPSNRLRCFMCGKYKHRSEGKWIKASTTIPIFTCNKCIEEHGEDEIRIGYEKM